MITKNVTLLRTDDKEKIALWKVSNSKKNAVDNIFLTHGTFSNKNICLGIANYFAKQGYFCYIMEWRNHGESAPTKTRFNFETIALYDINTVFTYLFEDLKLNSVHCITHSGGGIILSMFLIKNIIYNPKINSITMFACQAFGAANQRKNKIKILLSKYLTLLIGHIPAKIIGLGPHNESYYTMKQWFDWNLKKKFHSTDKKFDYKIIDLGT
ncbi:MAG: alpha/beta fold hydrolase [Xanthomarina gelatinilytica]|uniref:alpha/beta fold hydrolase n=1 Tax=Xanthomarina gelatinilytica TaxID=1137281 RepID=UPI003A856043